MEIRTLAPNGILFYAQVTTHMYMCLYLQVSKYFEVTLFKQSAYDQIIKKTLYLSHILVLPLLTLKTYLFFFNYLLLQIYYVSCIIDYRMVC